MNHTQVHQPDDKGFKSLLEGHKAFHELLRHFIPDIWTRFVEEDQLVRVDKSFISLDYVGSEADIVYRCKVLGKAISLGCMKKICLDWKVCSRLPSVWNTSMMRKR